MDKVSYAGETLLRWKVGHSTFLALPQKGARLMNWNVTLGDGTVRDVIYWPENADLNEIANIRGGNPILFPFNARTFDQGDIHFWRDSDGVRRPMPMHGLARQGEFKLTQADNNGFTALFQPDEAAHEVYPYDYEFTVRYRFEALRLICELSLHNCGDKPIPWSDGHHFYFTVPWTDGLSRADYAMRIPAKERYRHAKDGSLVPGPDLKEIENMDNPDLSDCIHLGLSENAVIFGEKGHAGDVVVTLGTDDVPVKDSAFVTWTESPEAPFFCVEPWMGPPNSPEHKRGLHHVAPGQTQTFTVTVKVK